MLLHTSSTRQSDFLTAFFIGCDSDRLGGGNYGLGGGLIENGSGLGCMGSGSGYILTLASTTLADSHNGFVAVVNSKVSFSAGNLSTKAQADFSMWQ